MHPILKKIEVLLNFNAVLVSRVPQSDSSTYMSLSRFFFLCRFLHAIECSSLFYRANLCLETNPILNT